MNYEQELFNRCFDFVLKNEGGYSNDPDDLGGETYKGISRRFWKNWPGWEIIDEYKKQPGFHDTLNKDESLDKMVREFYFTRFWSKMNLDYIVNENAVLQLFDFGINAGIRTSTRTAQKIVNTTPDGILGVKTAFEINHLGYSFVDLFIEARICHYKQSAVKRPKNKKYLKGWINRAKTTKFVYKPK